MSKFLNNIRRAREARQGQDREPTGPKDPTAMTAEERLKMSIALRRDGLPHHDYPDRRRDLDTMRASHERAGAVLPEHGLSAWWRRLVGGGGVDTYWLNAQE